MFDRSKADIPAIIICTGPSLNDQAPRIRYLASQNRAVLYGVNNTFNDFDLDVWIACDPAWHQHYGKVEGRFKKFHWDKAICDLYGYQYVPGRWEEGVSTDQNYINYGHSSGFQALGLAVHHGHKEIYLAGFDMQYGSTRHYFSGLSNMAGEYPGALRKFSRFDKPRVTTGNPKDYSLFQYYETVASQKGLPCKIYNMTFDSAFRGFEFKTP
jgi:hypothetical protein